MYTHRLAAGAAAGAVAGILAATGFLVFHAIVIVPIWWSAGSAIVGGLVAGAAMGAALTLVFPHATVVGGLRAAAMLWIGLMIVSLALQLARRTVGRMPDAIEVPAAMAIVTTWGALAGQRIGRSWRSAIGGAIASIAALLISAGPLTTTSVRGLMIFASLLPVLALFGVTWAALRGLPTRSWSACISPAHPDPDRGRIPIP